MDLWVAAAAAAAAATGACFMAKSCWRKWFYKESEGENLGNMKPLMVNNGSQVISLASVSFDEVERKCCLDYKEELQGSFGPGNMKRVRRQQRRGQGRRRSGSSASRVPGSPNGMTFFCIGITVGIMYTIIARKREVEKLNELLKQTQELVQELEISVNQHEPEKPNDRVASERLDVPTVDNGEAMSQIEAELLAELELLELNVNRYISKRTPAVMEVNYSDKEKRGVSPEELSLRLYEVVESRLEARVMELQTALEHVDNEAHEGDFTRMTLGVAISNTI